MTLWIGGKDARNHLRYFPGEVCEVHPDGTYNMFLELVSNSSHAPR